MDNKFILSYLQELSHCKKWYLLTRKAPSMRMMKYEKYNIIPSFSVPRWKSKEENEEKKNGSKMKFLNSFYSIVDKRYFVILNKIHVVRNERLKCYIDSRKKKKPNKYILNCKFSRNFVSFVSFSTIWYLQSER